MSNFTFKGKTLNNLYSYAIQDSNSGLYSPKDVSGNPLKVGDIVLYIPGIKYARLSYVELIEIIPDGSTEKYLGFKQKNGQYTTTLGNTLYKVTNDFKHLHPDL